MQPLVMRNTEHVENRRVSSGKSTLPPASISFPQSCSLRQPRITPAFSRSQAINSSLLDNARAEGKHLRIISTTTWLTGLPRGGRQEPNKRKGEQRKLKIWTLPGGEDGLYTSTRYRLGT